LPSRRWGPSGTLRRLASGAEVRTPDRWAYHRDDGWRAPVPSMEGRPMAAQDIDLAELLFLPLGTRPAHPKGSAR